MSDGGAVAAVADPGSRPEAAPLVARDLSWRPVGRRLSTLDHLDLRIEAGQTVLLAGASGSGKSTVLLALAGLLDPEAGDLTGTVEGPPLRAMVFQQPEHTVVAETLARDAAFGPENLCVPRPEMTRRVSDSLAELVPEVPPDAGVFETSGGQLQRVSLAGALTMRPGVLLLDEPTSLLDADGAASVRAAIVDAARDRTVVIAEHDLSPWLDVADRLVVLGPRARIVADGPPREVLARDAEALRGAGLRLPGDDATPATRPPRPHPSSPPIASLDDVSLAHPDGSGRPLHTHLDLSARAGTLTAVTGPSGAGKSTLLRVLSGLDEPSAGRVRRPDPARIAAVPQNPEHSFVAASVREEVLASPRVRDRELADRLLAATDLAALAGANPFALSGGEQRRLALVAALAAQPELLILDEPTTGLDAARRDAVLDLLDTARADGCAVVVATHDLHLAARADHRVRLAPGPRPRPTPPLHRRTASARLNQLTLLAIGLLAMVGSFAVSTPLVGVLVLAPIVALSPLAVASWRSALGRALPVAAAMASVAWSVVLLSGEAMLSAQAWLLGAKEALRIGALVLPGVLLLGGLDATRLGDALGQRLHLPVRLVAGSTAGLAHLGSFRRTWRILLEARRLRGLAPRGSIRPYASATIGLLVTAVRSATVQSQAMDARGFATVHRRTWAEPSPFTRADAAGLAVGVALAVWPWVARTWLG